MQTFRHLHQPTGRTITHLGKEYLFFGGTAYLGLLTNPNYVALYKEGIDRYGLNNGTSRNNNVQLGIYDETERNMAQRFGFEDAVLLSSGYLAAQLAIRQLGHLGEFIYAPDTHPALWLDGNPLVFQDFETWVSQTIDYINHSGKKDFVIVSNTLDNLKPKYYDFSAFRQVDSSKKVCFLLDDSHGIGVSAVNKCFIDQTCFNLANIELVVVASLAKGMGTDAGIIFGPRRIIDYCRRSTLFTGASPSSPASIYALSYGQNIYIQSVEKLQHNIRYLDEKLSSDIRRLSNFPVFTVDRPDIAQTLLEKGILISSFPYPSPSDPPINRIVVSSLHQQSDLDLLIKYLSE